MCGNRISINEMIERCKSELKRCFAPAIDFNAPYAKAMADMAIKEIIKAMREPTEKMAEAMGQIEGYCDCDPADYYQAAIDAVLND